jgi:hypothetical protein
MVAATVYSQGHSAYVPDQWQTLHGGVSTMLDHSSMQVVGQNMPGKGRDVMRAIVQDVYGSADRLRLSEIEKPVMAANEVLVQVRAAGVDRGTCHLMRGEPYLMRILGLGFRGRKTTSLGWT